VTRRYALFLCLFAVLSLMTGAAIAQVKVGKSRPLETKVWMKTVNGPHCSARAKMLKAGPADDKEWEEAATHAQLLNESGFVLMADGRCPDKVWAEAAKSLQDGSAALMKDISAKNKEGAQANMQTVLASCKSCHTAHRQK
jgi:cytochrome c553